MKNKVLLLIVALVLGCPAFGQNVILNSNDKMAASFPVLSAPGNTQALPVPQLPWVHTVQLIVTGTPAACTATLQGSMDGINFFSMNTAQTCTSTTMFAVNNFPVLFVRVNLATLSGGTAPTVTAFYGGVR